MTTRVEAGAKARVLHVIPTQVIGGAQRTVATLCKTASLDSRVEISCGRPDASIEWSDVIVIHSWRVTRKAPALNVPPWLRRGVGRATIIFNHDWEGRYDGAVDLVLVYSAFAAARWSGPQEVAVLPGGITLERFSQVARSRPWLMPATVGRLSTLHSGKVSPQTLAGWPRIRARVLWVGGDGPQMSSLRGACTDPRFRFVGEVPPSRTHEFLARTDIFLYETDWHIESFCYVILEALAAGCVVVASRRGAVAELIEDGANGFLFDDPERAIELCNALLKDPERCRTVSAAATASARRFPSELMRSRFTAHVARLLGRGES